MTYLHFIRATLPSCGIWNLCGTNTTQLSKRVSNTWSEITRLEGSSGCAIIHLPPMVVMTATAPSMYVSSHLARFSYNCNKFCNLHSSPSKIGQTEELPFILSVTISGLHLDSKHLQRRVVIDLFLQRPAAHSTCMFHNPGSIYYVWRWGAAFALTWLVTLLWWSKKIWYVLDILRYFRHLTLHRSRWPNWSRQIRGRCGS